MIGWKREEEREREKERERASGILGQVDKVRAAGKFGSTTLSPQRPSSR